MQFEWDEDKNRLNIRKHGLDFNDVPRMFQRCWYWKMTVHLRRNPLDRHGLA